MASIAFSKLTKLQDESLVDNVYKEIKNNVLSHVLKGGEKLSIKQIAREMGISLTPVRDAVNKLAHDGLLTTVPGSGTYVTSLTPQDVNELFECRNILELAAIESAVPRMTETAMQELRRNLEQMLVEGKRFLDTLTITDNHESQAIQTPYFELDDRFHETIVMQACNRQLLKLYNSVNLSMHVVRAVYWDHMRHVNQRMESTFTEHQRILDAIEAGNIDAAKAAVRRHLEQGKLVALSHMLKSDEVTAG
jgi:GntR family transcriptional regulator, rspAB operon transcriptional repressor